MLCKSGPALLLSSVLLVSLPGIASAHAVVYPKSANAGSYEKFTLRVPTEKESGTVQVKVQVPGGFVISRVKPLPGWTYTMEKSADGKSVQSIAWTGGTIKPGEFQEFEFQGKTAAEAGKYAFPAWQTYADGNTVAWTGPSEAATPASVVELKAAAGAVDAHGQQQGVPAGGQATPPAEPATGAPDPAANPMNTAAAYGGLLLGGAALVVSLRRR